MFTFTDFGSATATNVVSHSASGQLPCILARRMYIVAPDGVLDSDEGAPQGAIRAKVQRDSCYIPLLRPYGDFPNASGTDAAADCFG